MCQSIDQSKNMPYSKDFYQPNRRRIFNNEFLQEPHKENPVLTDIKTVLFILKATGLLPIFEKVSHYEIAPPTRSNEYYSFFVRGVVHALTVFHLYHLFTPGSTEWFYSYRDTDNVNQWIEIIMSIITYSATVFICGRNAQTFLNIINEIFKVDEEVRDQFRTTLNNKCGFSVKFLVIICVCQSYMIGLKVFAQYGSLTLTSYILIGFYALQNGLSTIFVVFAAALLRIIAMRFAFLNLVLTSYTYKLQLKPRRTMRHIGDYKPMEKFPEDSLFTFRMHNKLLRIYKTTNDSCSLILVSYMGYAFYTITTNTYNLFVQITTGNEISAQVVQWGFTWLILHTSLLTLLSRGCGEATSEANTTSQILARVYGKSKEYQNIIDKFLTKSIKQEVQFTAYGFFVIDNSTLFKIFSAVTTYLVILIQFKQLEDSKMEDQIAANT